jgi:hypothetical protein
VLPWGIRVPDHRSRNLTVPVRFLSALISFQCNTNCLRRLPSRMGRLTGHGPLIMCHRSRYCTPIRQIRACVAYILNCSLVFFTSLPPSSLPCCSLFLPVTFLHFTFFRFGHLILSFLPINSLFLSSFSNIFLPLSFVLYTLLSVLPFLINFKLHTFFSSSLNSFSHCLFLSFFVSYSL